LFAHLDSDMGLAAMDVSDIEQPDMEGLAFYVLEILHQPVCVASRIEKLQRDFLWGGMGEEFKPFGELGEGLYPNFKRGAWH